jgi:hypothetical protein
MALTVEKVRTYTKDSPELNILLEGEYQSSKELVELAIDFALSDLNAYPPVTDYNAETSPNDFLLLMGVCFHLANSEAERQLRNQISMSAQGVTAGIDDKYEQYNRLALHYRGMFQEKVREYKTFLNMQQAWGEGYSPYAVINHYNFRNR